MIQEKTFSHFWLYRLLPEKVVGYFELIRFEKPIGFLLLMWPCWISLAILEVTNIKWYLIFFFGSFLMRSVGCIINDYFDRFIDQKVERTSSRPLAKGELNIFEAFSLMALLLIFSLIILMQFSLFAIIVALLSLPLIIIYPLMKRFTYWPQLVLGLTFSWGVLLVFSQFNENISLQAILFYIACIFWTLGYDTIYAYQDAADDIKLKLKSTAILFEKNGKIFVMLFYIMFSIFLLLSINLYYFNSIRSIILILFLIGLLLYIRKWDIDSKSSSNKFFKFNNFIGLGIFTTLIFF
tara:strand:- start:6244 stop:7128 length:885 start_codon:yes stop_codon:yes gene_type:complete